MVLALKIKTQYYIRFYFLLFATPSLIYSYIHVKCVITIPHSVSRKVSCRYTSVWQLIITLSQKAVVQPQRTGNNKPMCRMKGKKDIDTIKHVTEPKGREVETFILPFYYWRKLGQRNGKSIKDSLLSGIIHFCSIIGDDRYIRVIWKLQIRTYWKRSFHILIIDVFAE